jgi:hypothetical protein
MRIVGHLIGGEVVGPSGTFVAPIPEPEIRTVTVIERDPRAVIPTDDVAEVTHLLARIVRIAQGLSRDDQFRVRELVTTASATLSATTRIDPKDQAAFQSALRDAAKRG